MTEPISPSPPSPSAPLDLSLTDSSLQERLAIGVTSKLGARGSLTRCAATLLHQQQQQPQTSTTLQNKAAMIRDLRLTQLEMQKLCLQIQVSEAELQDIDDQSSPPYSMTQETLQTERAIVEALRQELSIAQEQQSCRHEYESLAEFAATKYPVSKHQLQAELANVEGDVRATKLSLQRATKELSLRQAQFHLVLQSLMDLKQSLKEPLEHDGNDMLLLEAADEDDEGHDDAMQVEPEQAGETGETLYNDL